MGNYLAPYLFDTSKSVLNQKYSGGPHGYGDPDDLSLRKVEKDVLIQRIINEKARNEYCRTEMEALTECSMQNSMSMLWKCRSQTKCLEKCLERAFNDEELRETSTKEYLDRRSEFRRTGIKVTRKEKYGAKAFLPPVGEQQHA